MRILILVVAVLVGCGGDVLVAAPELELGGAGGGEGGAAPSAPVAACDLVLKEPVARVYGAADCAAAVELVPLPPGDWEPGQRACMVDGAELVGVLTLVGPWRPGAVEYSTRDRDGCRPLDALPALSRSAWWQGMR